MNRYATILVLVTLATGYIALRTTDTQSNSEPISLQEALSNEQQVKDVLTQYRIFKSTLHATIDSLRCGEIRLKEAHAIVREASNRYYPKYLKMLSWSDKGESTDERLARNLAGHVHSLEHVYPTQPSPLAGLDEDLRELLAEMKN
jgi:hypothetical protein